MANDSDSGLHGAAHTRHVDTYWRGATHESPLNHSEAKSSESCARLSESCVRCKAHSSARLKAVNVEGTEMIFKLGSHPRPHDEPIVDAQAQTTSACVRRSIGGQKSRSALDCTCYSESCMSVGLNAMQ